MERFMQRGNNVLVRYTPQRPSMDPSSSTSSLRGSVDVDFHDVFGGPPRRYSGQDAQRSMSDVREPSRFRGGEEETVMSAGVRRAGLGDRPVFGEEGGTNRRRYPSEDFFDDIFRGGEDSSKDPYASSLGSRIMSPARPLPPPPKSDPFSSSLPSQFSLPARVNKGIDLPSFGSSNSNPYGNKDDPQNGPNVPPSRSNSQSSETRKDQDEVRADTRSAFRQSPLSIEFSLSSDGSVKVTESETDSGEALKKDLNVPIADSNQFHFSIYKWASKGVPLMLSLRGSNGSKIKDSGNLSKCMSSNGRIERDGVVNESSSAETLPGVDLSSEKDIVVDSVSTNKDGPDDNTVKTKPNTPLGRLRQKKEKVAAKIEAAAHKPESQPIRSVLFENDDGQGKDKSPTNVGAGRTSRNDEVEKVTPQSSPVQTADSVERNKIKGKVKDFVKIFNKETLPERVPIVDTQSQEQEQKSANAEDKPRIPATKPFIYTLDDVYDQKNIRSKTASVTEDSKATFTTIDDFFDYEFSVKEISEDQHQHMLITQSGNDDDFKAASDAKIRGWASGKETNIRSLLSTLQYVLWPESGWKPVPLVDIIEANAVKRSYQRALLHLHPDKLQQKGADAHKKYIAEQVFDKLQDAWIHFNSPGSL